MASTSRYRNSGRAGPTWIGRARGSGGGRSLILNAHKDTVAGAVDCLKPRIEGNRLYGRGADDMKGSLAAIMLVAADAAKHGLAGDVIVTAVADEEAGSIGTEAIARTVVADAAIVAAVLGECPPVIGVPFWTDAALLSAAGIPTVIFGPGGEARTRTWSGSTSTTS